MSAKLRHRVLGLALGRRRSRELAIRRDEQKVAARLGYGTRPDHPWASPLKQARAPQVQQPEGARTDQVLDSAESTG